MKQYNEDDISNLFTEKDNKEWDSFKKEKRTELESSLAVEKRRVECKAELRKLKTGFEDSINSSFETISKFVEELNTVKEEIATVESNVKMAKKLSSEIGKYVAEKIDKMESEDIAGLKKKISRLNSHKTLLNKIKGTLNETNLIADLKELIGDLK